MESSINGMDSLKGFDMDAYLKTIESIWLRYQELISTNVEEKFEHGIVTNPLIDPMANHDMEETWRHYYPSFAIMALGVPKGQSFETIYYNVAKHVILEIFRIRILGGAIDLNIVAKLVEEVMGGMLKEGAELPIPQVMDEIFLSAYLSLIQDLFKGRTLTVLETGETVSMLESMGISEPVE